MFVSLILRSMRIGHKHPDLNVVADLVHIEVPDSKVRICAPDQTVKRLSEAELHKLFRSLLTEAAVPANEEECKRQVVDAINHMPCTEVDPHELSCQSRSIRDSDKKAYKYSRRLAGAPQAAIATAAVSTLTSQAKRPLSPACARPRGFVRELVWQTADAEWANCGKPTDIRELLKMRARIMDKLSIEAGLNRNSMSVELGQWQKTCTDKN